MTARLTLITEPSPARTDCCHRLPLWTLSQGYISTCSQPGHYGQPLTAHPSLAVVSR